MKLETVLEKKQEVNKKEAEVKEKLDKAFKDVQEREKEVDKKIGELKEQINKHEMEELARKIVEENHKVDRFLTDDEWKKVIELVEKMNQGKAEEVKQLRAKK